MVVEAREQTGWVDHWAANLKPKYETVVAYINRFKDPKLSLDTRNTAAQIIRGELDRTLSDSLPIPEVRHGPMGRLRNRGIRCGRVDIRSQVPERRITGEVLYLQGRGFGVFGDVRSLHPLILEAGGESVIGDGLLGMMEAWQIREVTKRVFIEVAKMSTAA